MRWWVLTHLLWLHFAIHAYIESVCCTTNIYARLYAIHMSIKNLKITGKGGNKWRLEQKEWVGESRERRKKGSKFEIMKTSRKQLTSV